MYGARVVWQGLKDTYHNLFHFVLATLLWWLSVVLIVPGPAGTLALFAHSDPRLGTAVERMDWRETLRFVSAHLWRAWRLALLTIPVLLLLLYNIVFYGDESSRLGVLAPFWAVLFLIGLLITLCSFAVAVIRDQERVLQVVRTAAILVGARLLSALLMILVLIGLLFLGLAILLGEAVLVPLLLFLPATVAATVNRWVLTALRIPIADPLAPTPERALEGKQRRKWFGP